MQLKIWGLQMLHPIETCKRFTRKMTMKKELTRLQAHDRILYNGNIHVPEIALTFDDGPDPSYTPQILDILWRYGVKATFFCIGCQVAAYPHIVRREHEAGHVIGNHTYTHANLALLSATDIQSQLNQTLDAIQEVIGLRPMFFRPPYGSLSLQVLTQVYDLGITTVMWNDRAEDWARPGVDFIIRRILDLSNGAIILMHDGRGDRSQTLAALPTIIEGLQDRGLRFVTIQQMVDNLHKGLISSKTCT